MNELKNKTEQIFPKGSQQKCTNEPPKYPEPTATGNEEIAIMKHQLTQLDMRKAGAGAKNFYCAELAIRNISDVTIATALFEVDYYDVNGNVVDEVKHKEYEIKSGNSRAIFIASTADPDTVRIKSYNCKLTKAITADVEKIRICRHVINTVENGEEIEGIVKNISRSKTDAALVANFCNSKNENIGSKLIILRNIEPESTRQFNFVFHPREGDAVRTYSLYIIYDIEER
jgi:hypothetical protein